MAIYEEKGRGGEGNPGAVCRDGFVSCETSPPRLRSAPPRNFRMPPASATELSRGAERDAVECFAATPTVRWLDAGS